MSISRAAGASHGQEVDEFELRSIVEGIGRPLEQRTTLYGRVTTIGRRLRPVDDDGLWQRTPMWPQRGEWNRLGYCGKWPWRTRTNKQPFTQWRP